MNNLIPGVITGLVVSIIAFAIFMHGANSAQEVVKANCDAFGKMKVQEVVYECRKLENQK